MGDVMGLAEARPAFVRFERRAIEQRDANGATTFVNRDFAFITQPGSRDTLEKDAEDWFRKLAKDVREERLNPAWLTHYKALYQAFQDGEEPPENGVPIRLWPAVSPAEAKHLLSLHCRTVEDLAAANEELIGRLGMGGRALKQRAVDWLKGQKDTAPLVLQLETLRAANAGLTEQVTALSAQVAGLQGMMAAAPMMQPTRVEVSTPRDNTDALVADAIDETLGE